MSNFTSDQVKILIQARNDFTFFVNNIFSLSFNGGFIRGVYVNEVCRSLGTNRKTMRISAKGHMKSTALYAHFMWKLLFQGATMDLECHYFSHQEQMAGYHVGKIKQLISNNPYYDEIIDTKSIAESVIKYTWDGQHFVTLTPHGLIQFKRGIHCDIVYVDDPFQDPENELNPTIIYKINEIFKSNILDMPKETTGELHVAGTPQTNDDFFFDENITKRFSVLIRPAITEEGKALWPEYMDLQELQAKRAERTERIFSREYLCIPVYSTKAFFDKEKLIQKVVNPNLNNLSVMELHKISNIVVAGFDIGKKLHPSHLAVFEIRDNRLIMIHQKFMDNWPYSNGSHYIAVHPTQLEYLKLAITDFKIDRLYWDSTRGEFESFIEQRLLPLQMVPVVMTSKIRVAMATEFDKVVEHGEIELINDTRLIDQICQMTNDLKAIITKTGHADSFWSVCLALLYKIKDPILLSASSVQPSTGLKSLFEQESRIPSGW